MPQRTNAYYLNRKLITCLSIIFILFGSCALISSLVFRSSSTAPENLLFASIIFRHGQRTPTSFYPNDPYRNSNRWTDGLGALTKEGKLQMYELGRLLRARYNGFISQRYSPEDIYVLSSDHDRCLMSAQLCLAGLFPPYGDQIWHSHMPWQPIPVHTVPRNLDKLIVLAKPCPKYDKELKQIYSDDFFVQVNSENADFYKYLTKHSGKTINDVMGVEHLFNTLEVEKLLNLKLPEWAEKYYSKMKGLAMLGLASLTFTESTKRLKGGPLLAEVVGHMSKKLLGLMGRGRSMYLYSGHDVNIVSVLRTLGFTDIDKPEYAASIIFELYQPATNEGDHTVELWYLNNTEQHTPVRLNIPGCEETCKLKDFLTITKPLVPEDWEAECLAT